MNRNQQICIFLSIFMIFCTPIYAGSDETKSILLDNPEAIARIVKILKDKSLLSDHGPRTEYSMRIIKPDSNVDNKIVKNTFDPDIDYKLRIIDPCTKKEITDFFRPQCKFGIKKFQDKGKRYNTPEPGLRR
jgi:hypothetical protein